MKKMRFLALALLATAVTFTSCKKEEDDPNLDKTPTVIFNGGTGYVSDDNTVKIGEDFKIGIIANANETTNTKITNVVFRMVQNNNTETILDTTISQEMFNWEMTRNLVPVTKEVIGEVNWECEVTDKDGEKKKISLKTTIENAIEKRGVIEFGSWNDEIGSFYSVNENMIYTISGAAQNQEKVDMIFFKGAENGDTWAAPSNNEVASIGTFGLDAWTTKNDTYFYKSEMTAEDFDALEDNYASYMKIGDFNDEDGKRKINKLEINDVFMFKTTNDVVGIAKVVDLYTKGDKAKLDIIIKK